MASNEQIGNYYVGADGAWIPSYQPTTQSSTNEKGDMLIPKAGCISPLFLKDREIKCGCFPIFP